MHPIVRSPRRLSGYDESCRKAELRHYDYLKPPICRRSS